MDALPADVIAAIAAAVGELKPMLHFASVPFHQMRAHAPQSSKRVARAVRSAAASASAAPLLPTLSLNCLAIVIL
jgi:predicted lipid-binding transport protein (Tim44 family)